MLLIELMRRHIRMLIASSEVGCRDHHSHRYRINSLLRPLHRGHRLHLPCMYQKWQFQRRERDRLPTNASSINYGRGRHSSAAVPAAALVPTTAGVSTTARHVQLATYWSGSRADNPDQHVSRRLTPPARRVITTIIQP